MTSHSRESSKSGVFGAVEAGGTKFLCGVGDGEGKLSDWIEIPTESPDRTLANVVRYFLDYGDRHGALRAVGIASFGPLNLDPGSEYFGHITRTPKSGWQGTDIQGFIGDRLEVPVAIETDVNGAALAEWHIGAGRGLDNFVYVTVGTGVGVGVIAGGELFRGASHPEFGHILVPRYSQDSFTGVCPFHGDCLEGLASGPALATRFGVEPSTVPPDDERWELEAYYLAVLCVNLTHAYSPQKIVLGGGVMNTRGLLERVRRRFDQLINQYHSGFTDAGAVRLTTAELKGLSGLSGALLLAAEA